MHDALFSLKNVSFRFPENEEPTLNKVSFDIAKGERVVVSGPSGSGKSTLLYLLNRLYPLNCDGKTSGTIQLFGRHSEDYAPGEINHRVATVFQDPDSQFCMPTVEEELAFTLENLFVTRVDMTKRITDVLELTDLASFRHAVIQSLSGGMKQRVATACALIMNPEVLLLDEPISHLDPYTAKQFIEWLHLLQEKKRLTIIAVEHRLDQWQSFFTREISIGSNGSIFSDVNFQEKRPYSYPKREKAVRPETVLKVNRLSVVIDRKQLLSPLSFTVGGGEVVIIAGPNGSGKSTLVKSLCGVYPISSGIIESVGVGYVPQSPEYLFLEKNVTAELEFSGMSSKSELIELMDRLRLSEIKNAHPFSVSHGQKRRIAVGAMLADKRPVMLMDEPTAGQDALALLELHKLIEEHALQGVTFLIVTHDMEFAESIADSVMLIKDGQLTGKFAAEDVWSDSELLLQHHLLPPKGVLQYAHLFK